MSIHSLIKAIELCLDQINEEESEIYNIFGTENASIYSGNKKLRFIDYRIRFETSIVERIVFNLLKLNINNVGWELNYPENIDFSRWKTLKLDFGFDYIESSDYLFRNIVEVKFFDLYSKIPFDIFEDAFKLQGYSSPIYGEAGLNKFVLILFRTNGNISYQNDCINKVFISLDYIKTQKAYTENQNSFGKYFEYLLKYQQWSDNDIQKVINVNKQNIDLGKVFNLVHQFKSFDDQILTSGVIFKV